MSSLWATQFPDYPSTKQLALCGCVSADLECSQCVCDRVRQGAVHDPFGFKVSCTSKRSVSEAKPCPSVRVSFFQTGMVSSSDSVFSFRQRWLLHKISYQPYQHMTACWPNVSHASVILDTWCVSESRGGAILHDFFALGSSLSWKGGVLCFFLSRAASLMDFQTSFAVEALINEHCKHKGRLLVTVNPPIRFHISFII